MASPMQDCVVMLGDSLTQRMDTPGNLHQRMAEAYQRKLDIHNRGFGGFNTAWAVPLLDHIFFKKDQSGPAPVVRLVTIWYGTNDSVHDTRDQYLPIETFRHNMNHILDSLTSPSSPYAVADTPVSIVLITPGPCLHSQMEDFKRPHRSLKRTEEFREEVIRLGQEWKGKEKEQQVEEGKFGWKIDTLDFWGALVDEAGGVGEELAPYFFDGVHMTTAGYTLLWNKLAEVIKTEFKGRGLDWEDENDLPMRIPWFGDIDFDEPESVVRKMALPKIRGGMGPIKKKKETAFEV